MADRDSEWVTCRSCNQKTWHVYEDRCKWCGMTAEKLKAILDPPGPKMYGQCVPGDIVSWRDGRPAPSQKHPQPPSRAIERLRGIKLPRHMSDEQMQGRIDELIRNWQVPKVPLGSLDNWKNWVALDVARRIAQQPAGRLATIESMLTNTDDDGEPAPLVTPQVAVELLHEPTNAVEGKSTVTTQGRPRLVCRSCNKLVPPWLARCECGGASWWVDERGGPYHRGEPDRLPGHKFTGVKDIPGAIRELPEKMRDGTVGGDLTARESLATVRKMYPGVAQYLPDEYRAGVAADDYLFKRGDSVGGGMTVETPEMYQHQPDDLDPDRKCYWCGSCIPVNWNHGQACNNMWCDQAEARLDERIELGAADTPFERESVRRWVDGRER